MKFLIKCTLFVLLFIYQVKSEDLLCSQILRPKVQAVTEHLRYVHEFESMLVTDPFLLFGSKRSSSSWLPSDIVSLLDDARAPEEVNSILNKYGAQIYREAGEFLIQSSQTLQDQLLARIKSLKDSITRGVVLNPMSFPDVDDSISSKFKFYSFEDLQNAYSYSPEQLRFILSKLNEIEMRISSIGFDHKDLFKFFLEKIPSVNPIGSLEFLLENNKEIIIVKSIKPTHYVEGRLISFHGRVVNIIPATDDSQKARIVLEGKYGKQTIGLSDALVVAIVSLSYKAVAKDLEETGKRIDAIERMQKEVASDLDEIERKVKALEDRYR